METRNARVFAAEESTETSEDGAAEGTAPTTVISAAPLPTVIENSAPTRREIPAPRPPGVPMGAPRVARRAQAWAAPTEFETAPVGPVPMPGERPSADVMTVVQQPRRAAPAPAVFETAPVGPAPMPGERPSADVMTVVQQPRRAMPAPAARAAEQRAEYVVGGDAVTTVRGGGGDATTARGMTGDAPTMTRGVRGDAATTVPRVGGDAATAGRGGGGDAATAGRSGGGDAATAGRGGGGDAATARVTAPARRESRGGLLLIGTIGLLAGFVVVLSVVVVRQQTELRETRVPAQRAAETCATYDAEVRAIAGELTQRAGDVAVVEHRIGERARRVVAARELQRLCVPDADPTRWACPRGEPECLAAGVMQLRQALARR